MHRTIAIICSITSSPRRILLIPPFFFFFFNDTPTPEISTLPLHDALPISAPRRVHRHRGTPRGLGLTEGLLGGLPARLGGRGGGRGGFRCGRRPARRQGFATHRRTDLLRSEEHTSELQSRLQLVFRLLL